MIQETKRSDIHQSHQVQTTMAGFSRISLHMIHQTLQNVNTGTKTPHEDNSHPQQREQQKHNRIYPNRVRHLTDTARPAYSTEKQSSKIHHKGHGFTNPACTSLDTYWTVQILGTSTKPLKAVGSNSAKPTNL
jgi:hypothetical protein